MPSFLNVIKEAEYIKKMYTESAAANCFNAIVHGPIKAGKTSLIKTCPKPIHIDSFDPGGPDVLRKEIDKGGYIVDNRFEADDPYNPVAFKLWMDALGKRRKMGYFEHIGTYVIDSITTWQQVIMNHVIWEAWKAHPKKRVLGKQPFEQDWLPQMQYIENYMRIFLALPCNCILLGHSEYPKDRDGKIVGDLGLMITGKLKTRIPALFSEIYYLNVKDFKTEERQLLTKPEFRIMAGTRIGGDTFEKYEKPDIRYLMKKAGRPELAEDKPSFEELIKQEEETNNE